jgi:hypothetical protein
MSLQLPVKFSDTEPYAMSISGPSLIFAVWYQGLGFKFLLSVMSHCPMRPFSLVQDTMEVCFTELPLQVPVWSRVLSWMVGMRVLVDKEELAGRESTGVGHGS